MSTTDDTAPAAETDTAAIDNAPLTSDAHELVPEAIAEAPAAPAASAAPAAPAPAPSAPAAPAGADPTADAKAPKWYRDDMARQRRENAELKARLERPPPAAPAPKAERPPLPNPAEDPQGYHEAITRQFNTQMQQMRLEQNLNLSERIARQQHGSETFEETKAWLTTRQDLEAYFIQQPDPWAAAIAYYGREKLADEIGEDPAAYRKRIEDEIRAKVEAEFQGRQSGAPAAPAPTMRSAPPAPASTARAAAPRDTTGRFTGPAPLKSTFKHSG